MRYTAVVGAICFWAATAAAMAQIQVSAQTQRSNFLLYERVDMIVTVSNVGDTDLVLDNNEGRPWLTFIVSRHVDHNYLPVRQERDSTFKGVALKAGESKTLRINLTPLYAFREEGDYKAAAVVDLPGEGEIVSGDVAFSVLPGTKVWSEMRTIDGSERIYSLVRFSQDNDTTRLYLRVEDPSQNLVYTNLSLGDLVAYIDPEVFFDPAGNLHVLHPCQTGAYLYTRTDAVGKVERQAVFKTFREVPPRLRKLEDGNVTVVGGLEEDPNAPREKLSTGQIAQKSEPAAPMEPTGSMQ